jgi:uncharacterized protein
MKFYNREQELRLLEQTELVSRDQAQMTFVIGRRRIGKTSLLIKATENKMVLYFFIAKKSEVLLCAEFVEQIKQKLNVPLFGEIKTFKDVFGLLMEVSKSRSFTLIIDEFQEFYSVNASVFSDMQHIWDINKNSSSMNLILCGSVYSIMTKIFENAKEPLFGRATQRIHLKAFDIATIKSILSDYSPHYTHDDVLAFYLFTGGVAKYVELLVQAKAFTFESMVDVILSENSLFLEEGKQVLIEEFGKEYGNYFSILSLISSGKTSRVEIESIMEMQTGGFLDRLENDFGLIKKVRPIFSKPNSKVVKYSIEDHFLRFWFRFIFKYRSALEMGNLNYIKEMVYRDYATFSGKTLEKYFVDKLKSEMKYNAVGTYWERNNQNVIDIVAVNDLEKEVLFAEVKRNSDKINVDVLVQKSQKLVSNFKGYRFIYKGFSMRDM